MKKRALCLFLALLIGTLMVLPALGATVDSGSCGADVTWVLDDEGVITITGTGDMDPRPVYDQRSAALIKSAIIGEGVTNVGEKAFCSFVWLERASIPAGVKKIGNSAFQNCRRLTEIVIPDGVTDIGSLAFSGCDRLIRVTIPASVKRIGYAAFDGCGTNVGLYTGDEGRQVEIFYEGTREEWMNVDLGDRNGFFQQHRIQFDPPAVRVTVGGNPVAWTDVRPYIDENNRTMVPLRVVAEALGMTVSWDAYRREASFSVGTKTLTFPIGSTEAVKEDGTTVKMDTAAVINANRTYAPIRYLAEYFGYTVDWDAASRTVVIK